MAFDINTMLGPDWKVDSSEVVTAVNQMNLVSSLPDACELKQLAVAVPNQWGNQSTYAPPFGWTVYYVSKIAGSSFQEVSINDTIWVSPAGVAYSVTTCSKSVAPEVVPAAEKKSNISPFILLGAVGLLAMITFND